MDKVFEELIRAEKLLEILNHDKFVEIFENFDSKLTIYLSKEETIDKLLKLLIRKNSEIIEKTNLKNNSKIIFRASVIFSQRNNKIITSLLKTKHLKKLINIISLNSKEYSTLQGYLKNILNNILSGNEKKILKLLKFLEKDNNFVENIIKNLNGSNCEILIEIFKIKNVRFDNLKNNLFSFLLNYFFLGLSDNFDDKIYLLKKFFKALSINSINLKSSIDYSKIRKNHKKLSGNKLEEIFFFKLIFLGYLGSIDKITKFHKPVKYLNSFKIFKNSKRKTLYLIEILDCFSFIIEKDFFLKKINEEFLKNIFIILEENPHKDLIHYKIFELLEKIKNKINEKEELQKNSLNFIIKTIKNSKFPNEEKKTPNPISLNFLHNFLTSIKTPNSLSIPKKEEIKVYKSKLKNIYNYIPLEDPKSSIFSVSIKSSVKEVLFNSGIDYFGVKAKIIDEKKFHYEDEILNEDYLSSKSIDLEKSQGFMNSSFVKSFDFSGKKILKGSLEKKKTKRENDFILGDFKKEFSKFKTSKSTVFVIGKRKDVCLDDSFELISKSQKFNDLEDSFVEVTNY